MTVGGSDSGMTLCHIALQVRPRCSPLRFLVVFFVLRLLVIIVVARSTQIAFDRLRDAVCLR